MKGKPVARLPTDVVTEREDLPAQNVGKACGWSTVRMVEEVYTRADGETTLNVVLHEGRVREAR